MNWDFREFLKTNGSVVGNTTKKYSTILFMTVFLWTLMIGLIIQKFILIYVFPNFNAGHGLLIGTDYIKFHYLAVTLAENIACRGWGAWQMMPDGQLVSGIAAIFYTLIEPEPWVLLPWNALLHALAVLYIFLTLKLILNDPNLALIASLPFAIFPSSFTWTTMLHNENYLVPAAMVVIYSLVCLYQEITEIKPIKFIYLLAINFGGLAAIKMIRPSAAQSIAAFNLLALGIFLILVFLRWFIHQKDKLSFKHVRFISMILFITVAQIGVLFGFSTQKSKSVSINNTQIKDDLENPNRIPALIDQNKHQLKDDWQSPNWIPALIDQKIHQMVQMRTEQLMKFPDGATNIDEMVQFHSAVDVFAYFPRSLQIGFLSPFPEQWLNSGYKQTSKIQRLESGVEMVISYLALLGLPIAIWIYRKSFGLWYLIFLCAGMIIVYTIGMPNIGTLYRFRYPFYMPLVGIGLMVWIKILFKKRGNITA